MSISPEDPETVYLFHPASDPAIILDMTGTVYEQWLDEVRATLHSINIAMDDWQKVWPFDFRKAFGGGMTPNDAAAQANRFWWNQQDKVLKLGNG